MALKQTNKNRKKEEPVIVTKEVKKESSNKEVKSTREESLFMVLSTIVFVGVVYFIFF